MQLITNPCDHPHCWEPMCTDVDWMCPYFKPRLFGFIPIPLKLGERLMLWEESRFLKRYCKSHNDMIEVDDFTWDNCECVEDLTDD
jgi:hypothetical protein